jgi:hypothetical protein
MNMIMIMIVKVFGLCKILRLIKSLLLLCIFILYGTSWDSYCGRQEVFGFCVEVNFNWELPLKTEIPNSKNRSMHLIR